MPLRLRTAALIPLMLASGMASAFDPTRAPGYGSPDMYRPNVDGIIFRGDSSKLRLPGSPVDRLLSGFLNDSINPVSFGADPTGARDSTAAFNIAFLKGARVMVQPGIYLVNELRLTRRVHATLLPGAVLKGNALCAATATGNTPACEASADVTKAWGVVNFAPGSEGSVLDGGGEIDGNRDALVAGYLNLPMAPQADTYVSKYAWNCAQVSVANVRIENVKLKNCMIGGMQDTAPGGSVIKDVTVSDSSKVITLQGGNGTGVSNLAGVNISNFANGRVIPFWQYGFEIRFLRNFNLSGLRLNGYRPYIYTTADRSQRIGDPRGAAFSFDHMGQGTLDYDASGFAWDPADPRQINVAYVALMDSMTDVRIPRAAGRGYFYGAELSGPNRVSIGSAAFDCAWNTVANVSGFAGSAGFRLKGNGGLDPNGSLSSQYDHYTQMPAYQVSVDDITGTRCGVGAQIMSGNAIFGRYRFDANVIAGIVPWATESNGQYPTAAPFRLSNVVFGLGSASYNGGPGVSINDGNGLRFNGLVANDNGQDANGFDPVGISLTANGTPKTDIAFTGWAANDDQAFSLAKAASFTPGSTTLVNGRNTYTVLIGRGDRLHVGQRVTLANAGGPSKNIVGKILAISNDAYTLDTGTAATFSTSGNLTALSGTVSQSAGGYLLNGVGTNFRTAITGPAYLLINGGYYKIGQVISDTQLQMDTVPATGFSNVSAQIVQTDVVGIPSQHNGLYIPSAANASNVSWGVPGTYSAYGNTIEDVTVDDPASAAPGQPTGNHVVTKGATPSVSGCGTGATIRGTDTAMEVGTGSESNISTCAITFAKPFKTRPICTATRSGSLATTYSSVFGASTTGLNLSFSAPTPNSFVNVICVQ